MPRFVEMLRGRNLFDNAAFGMPDMDDSSLSDILSQAHQTATSLKNDDMFRQKQMMEFEHSLRNRRPMENAADRPELITRGPNAMKKHVTVYAPPTAMQQQFRQDAAKAGPGPGATSMAAASKFNEAMLASKMRTEDDERKLAQELNAKSEDRAYAETISARRRSEKLDDDKSERDFKSKEADAARTAKPGQILNTLDPNDPTKTIAVERGPDGKLRPLELAGGPKVGQVAKPGTKLSFEGADPKMQGLRDMTQSALDDIDELMDENDKLKSHAQDATGKSRMFGAVAEKFGLSSLTPETTKGNVKINSLKSKLVLDLIGQMKAQSKTGATGFGNMSNKDLAVLERAASKLDPNLSDDDFAAELKTVRQKLRMIMEAGPDEQKGVKDSKDKQSRLQEVLKRNGL